MKTKDGNKILRVLRSHVGQEEAISAPAICRALGIRETRERHVRQVIADESALWPDVVICATPGQGYFCAATFEELEAYDNWLAQLAKDAADKQRAFRRAAHRLGFTLNTLPKLAAA